MSGHEAIDELLAEAGVDGLRLRGALALLSGGRWWTLADLVRETATSRRTIESLLRVLPLSTAATMSVFPLIRSTATTSGLIRIFPVLGIRSPEWSRRTPRRSNAWRR